MAVGGRFFRRGGLAVRRLRGRVPESEAERRIVTGKAWEEFCDTLKAAGASLRFPDNHYQNASISGACEYRIVGNRGTVNYLAFGTQAGHYGQGRGMPPTGFLEGSRLILDERIRFEDR